MAPPATTTAQPTPTPEPYVSRINANPTPQELQKLYDEWASTYRSDLVGDSQNYVAPAITAQAVLKTLGTDHIDPNLKILDAGCGTGWVGANLQEVGAKIIDGCDISPGMLKEARSTGAYRELEVVDMTKPMGMYADGTYDVVTCIGTFLLGHVGPEALPEMVRMLKTGGIVVCTVRDNVWEEKGYKRVIGELEQQGKIRVISAEISDYRKGANVEAYLVIFSKV
jgi:predicted TPR repeat methyltransferase